MVCLILEVSERQTCPLKKNVPRKKKVSLYSQAAKECTIIHRCAIMDRLYGSWKIALEDVGVGKKSMGIWPLY